MYHITDIHFEKLCLDYRAHWHEEVWLEFRPLDRSDTRPETVTVIIDYEGGKIDDMYCEVDYSGELDEIKLLKQLQGHERFLERVQNTIMMLPHLEEIMDASDPEEEIDFQVISNNNKQLEYTVNNIKEILFLHPDGERLTLIFKYKNEIYYFD
ncbi:hypothetical protein [Paenibacillus cremeus]|uniref:Uncharacterized protein n=1 Tax=Paenibacillus cremeus TaxID=2163881 RepID=A0A559K9K7_9BACL|nr:hypothetical protein [Paenibacillus cremeus]TVY08802.1 hypothetical protein FPZ49_17275 [Paenibacillus cremeus]